MKALVAGLVVLAAAGLLLGPSLYYQSTAGRGCAGCHEIQQTYDLWRRSTHRSVSCTACHPGGFKLANFRRVSEHFGGGVPEQIRLKGLDVYAMMDRCRACHEQEFAAWRAGPHGSTFASLFLDRKHNSQSLLIDDCLRCHGAYFEGGIRDLVQPLNTQGPWRLVRAEWAGLPAMPCFACHAMHRRGEPLRKDWQRGERLGTKQEIARPSLALYDRREALHAADLPLPAMLEGARPVKMSPDRRQGLCYECHAPTATRQVASGDDRTPIGVHEGLSCLACHQKHDQSTRASCATCHPRLSNCGLDVEKMDTTFLSPKSQHDVHFVKCAGCHPQGVPKKRPSEGGLQPARDFQSRSAALQN